MKLPAAVVLGHLLLSQTNNQLSEVSPLWPVTSVCVGVNELLMSDNKLWEKF